MSHCLDSGQKLINLLPIYYAVIFGHLLTYIVSWEIACYQNIKKMIEIESGNKTKSENANCKIVRRKKNL